MDSAPTVGFAVLRGGVADAAAVSAEAEQRGYQTAADLLAAAAP